MVASKVNKSKWTVVGDKDKGFTFIECDGPQKKKEKLVACLFLPLAAL